MSDRYIFSILGAYNHDPTIFDGLTLPEAPWTDGYPDLFKNFPKPDKALLISNLVLDCAQLSLLHTDTDFLKEEITLWSRMHALDWQQYYETLFYHYNPIWNKDGVITDRGSSAGTSGNTRTVQGNDSRQRENGNVRTLNTRDDNEHVINTQEISSKTLDNVRTLDTAESNAQSGSDRVQETGSDDNTTVNSVNAFNAGSPTEHDRTVSDEDWSNSKQIIYGKEENGTNTGTITDEQTGSGSVANTGTITDGRSNTGTITDEGTGSESGEHEEIIQDSGNSSGTTENERIEHGNIGVTMTQQMIREQRDVIMNFYQYIIGQFKERFCILIW